jgi:hypothetical protein
MQRNMDLVRMILMRLESSPSEGVPRNFGIMAFLPDEIDYHAHIMMQEGLIERGKIPGRTNKGLLLGPTLTWKGHEFLELARDQERWNRAKTIIAKVGGAPVSVWMKVLTDLALQDADLQRSALGPRTSG